MPTIDIPNIDQPIVILNEPEQPIDFTSDNDYILSDNEQQHHQQQHLEPTSNNLPSLAYLITLCKDKIGDRVGGCYPCEYLPKKEKQRLKKAFDNLFNLNNESKKGIVFMWGDDDFLFALSTNV